MIRYLSFFSILFCLQVFGQNTSKDMNNEDIKKLSSFIQALQNFSETIPQEKVYLHFDNTSYYKGDNIWFKCYVVSTERNELSILSKTLYVELLNPGGDIISKKILKIENGQCHGDFQLDQLPFYSGYYEVRAYTKYMLNFGDDIIFSRVFPVFDKPKTDGAYEEKKMLRWGRYGPVGYPSKRENPVKGKTVNLSFFPEGGNLIQGVESRIAFEATDENGNPVDITGIVFDDRKQELCKFSTLHEGRGIFVYTPANNNKKDIAEIEYSGKKYRFDLPQNLPQGIVMKVDNLTYSDSIFVTLSRNSDTPAETLGVAVLTGGVLQSAFFTFTKDEEIKLIIDKTELPAGVSRIVLFNSAGRTLCDRLVFTAGSEDFLNIKAKTNKHEYLPYESIEMELSVVDNYSDPVKTNFSLSVRDGASEIEYKHNILTNLLLTSEMKGYVRDPAFYFEEIAGQARNDRQIQGIAGDPESSSGRNDKQSLLDLLLMVQGWRRYSLDLMFKDIETFEPKYFPEQGIITEGTVVSFVRQIPKPNVDVSLLLLPVGEEDSKKARYFETFVTDSTGRFNFISDVTGKWNMILATTEKSKKKDYRILLDRLFSPDPKRYNYTEMQANLAEDSKNLSSEDDETGDIDEGNDEILESYIDSLAQVGIDKKVRKLPAVKIVAKHRYHEQDVFRNRSTSIAYYDMPSELNDVYDRGEFLAEDIHKLLKSLNNEFIVHKKIMSGGKRGSPVYFNDVNAVGDDILFYRGKKVFFVIDYKPAKVDEEYGDYFYYKTIRLNAIKSIYINENKTVMAKYLENGLISPIELADKFGCAIFIETFPKGKIPVDAGKGVRKTWLEGYSEVKEFYSPDYSSEPIDPDDYRRTLYWNPMVATDDNGVAKIKFYNNSNCKKINISAETVTQEGVIGVCW